uniref:Annexin n=1 Tax=Quercus lobata TaxID=97700 RepID=A0A7N2KVX5_QUELO
MLELSLKLCYYNVDEEGIERRSRPLVAYVSTPRYEGLEFDREIAVKDSKALFKAVEKKLGTDEKTFIHIFSERSRAQLAAIISAYHDMYGHSLKKAVKGETSGLFEYALLTILSCSENPVRYFGKVLSLIILWKIKEAIVELSGTHVSIYVG